MRDDSKAPYQLTMTQADISPCYATRVTVDRNPIEQLLIAPTKATLSWSGDSHAYLEIGPNNRVKVAYGRPPYQAGERILILRRSDFSRLLDTGELNNAKWYGDLRLSSPDLVTESIRGRFSFKESDPGRGIQGLRSPQIGAVHSVLGYWTTQAKEPATVVMPTGTGKTDTMLALYCAASISRLLIIVPSDALRSQIAEKFLTLGVLQQFGIVPDECLRPVVGQIKHGFKSTESAIEFVSKCNVVIATPPALNSSPTDTRNALLSQFTHLFIDEAHHVAASTWRSIRDDFSGKQVVQFTATPFREDGQAVGGRFVYTFPLREAQKLDLFSPINFISVLEAGDHDRAIARRAVEKLMEDTGNGFDHLVMARVKSISRAEEVLQLYRDLAPELTPVILHSNQRASVRKATLNEVRLRSSRIVVCVNMLGEGFDLPALKIAAIHDAHRSLGVTLQFIGRFARTTGQKLGSATAIVARPGGEFDPQLRRLYAEDADWNFLISDLSEGVISKEHEISEFEAAFQTEPEAVSLRSLLPKMSTVVYKTACADWTPSGIEDQYAEVLITNPIGINHQHCVAWFVVESRSTVDWAELKTVEEVTHDLYIVYWDKTRQLLYINSSDNGSLHKALAEVVCGESVRLITGENVYRSMAHVHRLVPTNVGLLDVRNRSRRFSMHVGADVVEGFPTAEAHTKTKTNIFAYGYETGTRVSIGASLKGRIWSYRRAATLKHWVDWCDHVGIKLIDDSISVDNVISDFIRPEVLEHRPDLVPLMVDWTTRTMGDVSDEVIVLHGESKWPVIDVQFEILEHARTGPIKFLVNTPNWKLPYELNISEGAMSFAPLDADAQVLYRRQLVGLSEYFSTIGVDIYFEQDAVVVPPAMLLKPNRELPPFDTNKLQAIDWTDIDLRVESQGDDRREDSIQARMIRYMQDTEEWDVVVDDDASGEVADIVALRVRSGKLYVTLNHCKFVRGGKARAQVADLYEVCGQAQRSTKWKRNPSLMVSELIRRQRQRYKRTGSYSLMHGSLGDLYRIQDTVSILEPIFSIAITQPGLSKKIVTPSQLELLASTETYLFETAYATFHVYCSD